MRLTPKALVHLVGCTSSASVSLLASFEASLDGGATWIAATQVFATQVFVPPPGYDDFVVLGVPVVRSFAVMASVLAATHVLMGCCAQLLEVGETIDVLVRVEDSLGVQFTGSVPVVMSGRLGGVVTFVPSSCPLGTYPLVVAWDDGQQPAASLSTGPGGCGAVHGSEFQGRTHYGLDDDRSFLSNGTEASFYGWVVAGDPLDPPTCESWRTSMAATDLVRCVCACGCVPVCVLVCACVAVRARGC